MTLVSKLSSFTSPGAGSHTPFPITGLGFQPKIMFFWGNRATANMISFTGADMPGTYMGVSTAAGVDFSVAQSDDFSSGNPFLREGWCHTLTAGTGTSFDYSFRVDSFDSDGFTGTWSNVSGATLGIVVNYLALGGSDISNAKIVVTDPGPNATGNFPISGFGFAPSAILLGGGSPTPTPGAGPGSQAGLGFAANGSGSVAYSSWFNAGLGRAATYQRNDKAYVESGGSATGHLNEATLGSWDSDGFTLNYTIATRYANNSLNNVIAALGMNGPQFAVGSFNTPTSTTTPQVISGLPFQPVALLFMSGMQVHSSTAYLDPIAISHMFGGCDSALNQSHAGQCDWTNAFATETNNRAFKLSIDNVAQVVVEASVTSINTDGFTLTYAVADASNSREVLYMAIGAASGAYIKTGTGKIG